MSHNNPTPHSLRLVIGLSIVLAACFSPPPHVAGTPRTSISTSNASSAFPLAAPEDVGLARKDLDQLADTVTKWVAVGRPVGAELLVVKNGRTVRHEAIGWRDRAGTLPLQPNSIFRIRSMTKPVIGTAVLMLKDEDRIALDDPVANYLPSFDHGRSRAITVRQLLTHTSGLAPNGFDAFGLPKEADTYESLRAVVDDIGAIGPTTSPGVFRYSDAGSATLAALVAEVSGAPVEHFLATRIFEPLGMRDTYTRFSPAAAWADRLCSTYKWSGETLAFERYWDPSQAPRYPFFRGCGGIYTTPADYARFVSMWMAGGTFDGRRLLSEDTVKAALRPLAGGQYGHQWRVPETPIVAGMPTVFGHEGSDSTIALALPATDTIVLYFTQSRGPGIRPMFRAALSRVPAFAEHVVVDQASTMLPERFPDRVPLNATEAGAYAGDYIGSIIVDGKERMRDGFTYSVRLEGGSLRGTLVRPGGLHDYPLPGHDLIPVAAGSFVPGRIFKGRIVEVVQGASIQFHEPAAGGAAPNRVEIRTELPALRWQLTRVLSTNSMPTTSR